MNEDAPSSPQPCPRDWAEGDVARLLARVTRPGRYVGGEFNLAPQAGARAAHRAVLPGRLRDRDLEPGSADPLHAPERRHAGRRPSAPTARGPTWPASCAPPACRCGRSRACGPWRAATSGASRSRTSSPTPTCSRCSTLPACRCAPRSAGRTTRSCSAAARRRRPLAAGAVLRRLLHRRGRSTGWTRSSRRSRRPRGPSASTASAAVPGVWLPGTARRTGRAPGLHRRSPTTPPVLRPVVPVLEAVHDRAVVEVMRGCTAGCRFCQAGMWYRPVRERPVDLVVDAADGCSTRPGCDEVSLISLSSCDYSGIEEAVTRIRGLRPGVRVSLPSLRIDSAAVSLARFAAEQRGSVTLAPEAGTQELRDAINKGVDEAQFDEAVRAVFGGGFTGLKLYFMIGLPGERDEDVARHRPHGGHGRAPRQGDVARPRPALGRRVVLRAQGAHAVPARAVRRRADPAPPPAAAARRHAARRARVVPRRRRLGGGGDAGARRPGQRPARRERLAAGRALRRLERALPARRLAGGRRRARRRARREPAWAAVRRPVGRGRRPPASPATSWPRSWQRGRRGELTEDCRDGACVACGVCGAGVEMEVLA